MKLNWNFLGGVGCKTKNLPWGGVWIFSGTTHFVLAFVVDEMFYFENFQLL